MKFWKILLFCLLVVFISNATTAYSSGFEKNLWRFAGLHEGGDIEPSEFCYITFGNNHILMHWITPGDPESIDVFKITKKGGNKFCAKNIKSYGVNDYKLKENSEIYHKNICGKFLNEKLMLDDWITLDKNSGNIRRAFPEELLERYINN